MCRAGQAEKLAAILARLRRPAGHASRSHDAVRRAKTLGQNFLYNREVLSKFAAAAGDLNSSRLVIEIGAGPGGLTTSLLAAGAQRVVAVERDAACVEALCDSGLEQAAQGKLRLIHGDARKIGLTQICDEEGVDTHSCVSVVGNLPFSVGTRLLVGWVNPPDARIGSFTLLFQTEVAERICGKVNTSQYSRLSVLVQAWATARALHSIPAEAFVPPPKVGTTLVSIVPHPPNTARDKDTAASGEHPSLSAAEAPALLLVTAAAFRQRRKMLRSSLAKLPRTGSSEAVVALCAAAGVEPTLRAGAVEVSRFIRLARAYSVLEQEQERKQEKEQ